MKDRRTGKVACYFVRGLSVSTMTSGDQHVLCGEVNNVVLKQSRQGLICFKAEFCPAGRACYLKKNLTNSTHFDTRTLLHHLRRRPLPLLAATLQSIPHLLISTHQTTPHLLALIPQTTTFLLAPILLMGSLLSQHYDTALYWFNGVRTYLS